MNLNTALAAFWLVLCLVLGGASAAGWIANGALQVLAILLILFHMWTAGPALPPALRLPLLAFVALIAVAALSLVPLPADLWSGLPGRAPIARGFALLGLPLPNLPLSLDARRTVNSVLSVLPPLAAFLLATRLTRDERVRVVHVLLIVAVGIVVLGALQLFGGEDSNLRLYEVTIAQAAVGTFANPNHLATLLLMALPFGAFLIGTATGKRGKGGKNAAGGRGVLYGAITLFLLIGIAVNGSLAGYGLLLPVAALSYLLIRRVRGPLGWRDLAIPAVAAVAFAGLSLAGPLNDRSLNELSDDPTGRKISIPTTIAAAQAHFPIGSGLGTFRDIYRTYERAEDVSTVFVNHAHNDYAEVALELGLAGLLLVAALLGWIAVVAVRAWRGDFHGAGLARAASVALFAVAAHSLVDYPLRTAAIASLAAFCCALLAQPPAEPARRGSRRDGGARHLAVE